MTGFDASEIENARQQYAEEAKRRWGDTDAWKESQKRNPSAAGQEKQAEKMNAIFRRVAALRQGSPASPEAQAAVADWQAFVTETAYPCTKEILAGLGAMYAGDRRFGETLDRFGAGTASFFAEASAVYCAK